MTAKIKFLVYRIKTGKLKLSEITDPVLRAEVDEALKE